MADFTIDIRRFALYLLLFCVAAEVAFILLDWHVNYGDLTHIGAIERLFNATREDGIGSWFAVTQTFLAGLTAVAVFSVQRRIDQRAWMPYGWLVIALFFFYMSVDDGAKIHERLGTTFKILNRGSDEIGGTMLLHFPSYTWQLIFLPAFGSLGLFTLGFLWLDSGDRTLRLIVLLAIGCFVVAVGMDFVEGLERDHPANLYTILVRNFDMHEYTIRTFSQTPFKTLRHFSKTFEESIEMLGNSALWYVFLRRLGASAHEVRIRFANA